LHWGLFWGVHMQNTTGLSLYVYFKRNECSDGVFSLAEDFS
jgi:hypothetical protein